MLMEGSFSIQQEISAIYNIHSVETL